MATGSTQTNIGKSQSPNTSGSPLSGVQFNPPNSGSGGGMAGFAAWVASWFIIIGVLTLFSRTDWGRPIVYYVLWLSIIFVLVTQSEIISGILQQGNILQGNI